MRTHELKSWPEPFKAVSSRRKLHEFRKNDREFMVGDYLRLREWDPKTEQYSGHYVEAHVLYVGTGFGVPEGYVCMSIEVYFWKRPGVLDA